MPCSGSLRPSKSAKSRRTAFSRYYFLFIAAIYSLIPYKTPWLALNLWLPLALFAARAIEFLWRMASTSVNCEPHSCRSAFSRRVLPCLIAHDTRQRVFFILPTKQILTPTLTRRKISSALPAEIAEICRSDMASPIPRIAVIAADPWPLPWYLRHFSQVGFWQPGQQPGDADFYITSTDVAEQYRDRLQRFPRGILRRASGRAHPAVVAGAEVNSYAEIHPFNHGAMATHFQVRIANEEKTYAAQAAQAAFDLLDGSSRDLSRFRANSDIAQVAQLAPGEKMRLSEPAFACLEIAKRWKPRRRAHSATPAALQSQPALPQWELLPTSTRSFA